MTRRQFAAVAFAASAACAVWASCAIYDPTLLLPAPPIDSSADAPADPCAHARWPERPTAPDTATSNTIVVAVHSLDLGLSADSGPPAAMGYDLDHQCTCPAPETCTALVPGATHCDDDAGRDNSGAELLRKFALLGSSAFNQDAINRRIDEGNYSLVIRVRNYNGTPNDPSVEFAAFASVGTPILTDGGKPVLPKWDGTDEWVIRGDSILGGPDAAILIPNYVDPNAYVRDGVIVATLDFPILLAKTSGASLSAELSNAVVTAPLKAAGAGFSITGGRVTGRWPTRKVLYGLHGIGDPLGGGNLCPGKQSYADIKSQVCRAADIVADPTKDGKGNACDSLSLGLIFNADPARLGEVRPDPPATDPCGDAGVDDCR